MGSTAYPPIPWCCSTSRKSFVLPDMYLVEYSSSSSSTNPISTLLDMPTGAYMQGHPPPAGAPNLPPQGLQSFHVPGAPQIGWEFSNCTGKRKALLIGINYFGQRGQLRGCINDVKNMSTFLHDRFNYKREDMVILTDDQQNPRSQPTKQNIMQAMHWLVKDAQPNDSLFFHYSGISCEII